MLGLAARRAYPGKAEAHLRCPRQRPRRDNPRVYPGAAPAPGRVAQAAVAADSEDRRAVLAVEALAVAAEGSVAPEGLADAEGAVQVREDRKSVV